jgi:hypothetical protein
MKPTLMDIQTKAIPNHYTEAAASPTSRKALVTMNRELWIGCFTETQKRNGISQKDKENLYLQLAEQWGLKFPIEQISYS